LTVAFTSDLIPFPPASPKLRPCGAYNNSINNDNNNNNNTQDNIYSVIIYGASLMWEFTLGPLSESQVAPGGRQLVGQTAKLPSSPPVGCYGPHIRPLPFVLLLNHEINRLICWKFRWKPINQSVQWGSLGWTRPPQDEAFIRPSAQTMRCVCNRLCVWMWKSVSHIYRTESL